MLSLTPRQKRDLHAWKLRNRHEIAPLFRIREASLLDHQFDLPVDYLSNKPINRDMHPITLLALHNEVR
jgi:hypothetical protein